MGFILASGQAHRIEAPVEMLLWGYLRDFYSDHGAVSTAVGEVDCAIGKELPGAAMAQTLLVVWATA